MTTAHKSRVLDMTRGDPFRLLLQFSLPLFCSNMLQQVYNLTDTALAGHLLGSAALAEIGATAALYGLIMNFAFGMNNGLALTVSRCFGAGEREGIRRAVGWMVTLSAAVSIVLTTVSLLGRGALLQVLQVPAEVWDGAAAYLTVILLGIPLTMLYNMEAALLRAVGNSVTPLLFLLFSSVLNVGLDAAFMGPLGMGVRGAAVATVLAQGISAVLGPRAFQKVYPPRGHEYVLGRHEHGPDECDLQSGQRGAAKQHQRAGQCLYHGPNGGPPHGRDVLYPGRCAWHRRGNLQQPEPRRRPPQPHLAERPRSAEDLFCLVAFTFLLGEPVLRLITGSSDARIISNAMLYLKISVPIIPPMAVLVILRNMLQGIRHTVEPLLASALELIGKVIFAVWLVPVWGYRAVCFCEPTTWVICFVFILLAVWRCRSDLQDACPPDKTPA